MKAGKTRFGFAFFAGFFFVILITGWVHSARSANSQQGLQEPIRVEGGAVTGTPAW